MKFRDHECPNPTLREVLRARAGARISNRLVTAEVAPIRDLAGLR